MGKFKNICQKYPYLTTALSFFAFIILFVCVEAFNDNRLLLVVAVLLVPVVLANKQFLFKYLVTYKS